MEEKPRGDYYQPRSGMIESVHKETLSDGRSLRADNPWMHIRAWEMKVNAEIRVFVKQWSTDHVWKDLEANGLTEWERLCYSKINMTSGG